MIAEFYDKVVVKFKYNNENGTGVLISDAEKKRTFLITAWHCLNSESEIDYSKISIFRQIKCIEEEMFVTFRGAMIVQDYDILVLMLDYIVDIPEYQIVKPSVGEKVVIVGFPNALKDSTLERYSLRGEINELPGNAVVQINCRREFQTFENTAKNNMAGYSGSGIFIEIDSCVYLCGIVTELLSGDGVFSAVNGVLTEKIDEVLHDKNGVHLANAEWHDFGVYSGGTLEIFEEPLKEICAVQASEIKKDVTPHDIIKHCGKKLVWPYSDKDVLRNEVWENWLLYLIIRSIENRDNLKDENYYVVKKSAENQEDRNVKVFYSTKHSILPEFLKDYLHNACNDVKRGELIIVKTNKVPAKKKISSDKIDKIVADISKTVGEEKGLYIDDVASEMRHISIIHMQALADEMEMFVEEHEEMTGRTLEKALGVRIMEVLHEI